jgi:hypothetical protein
MRHFCMKVRTAAALAGLAMMASTTARAGTDSWNGTAGGSWTDTGKWSLGAAPGNGDDAVFNLGAPTAYTITVPSDQVFANLKVLNDKTAIDLQGHGFPLVTNIGSGTVTVNTGSSLALSSSSIFAGSVSAPAGWTVNGKLSLDNVNISALHGTAIALGDVVTATNSQINTSSAGNVNINAGGTFDDVGVGASGNVTIGGPATITDFSSFGASTGVLTVNGGTAGNPMVVTLDNSSLSSNGSSLSPNVMIGTSGYVTLNMSNAATIGSTYTTVGPHATLTATGTDTTVIALLSTSGQITVSASAKILSPNCGVSGVAQLDTGATWPINNGLTINSDGTVKVLSGATVTPHSFTTSGHLEIGLSGPSASQNGKLVDLGAATFAGTLDVTLHDGFVPTANQSFDLMDFTGESGNFTTVNLPNVGAGASWDTSQLYTTGVIKLTALLNGDANLDGTVNVADLGALSTSYGATSGANWSQGDFNNDGAVNVADLGALATNYGQSVGGGGMAGPAAEVAATAAVPEPGSATIVLGVCLAAGAVRRRRSRALVM